MASEYTTANQILIKDIRMAMHRTGLSATKCFADHSSEMIFRFLLLPLRSPGKTACAALTFQRMPLNSSILSDFTCRYYKSGPGKGHPHAEERWRNAEKVRFNLETKIDPRPQYAGRTFGPEVFTETLAKTIESNGMEARSDIQSFDFRTLFLAAKTHPKIQTVFLIESVPVPPGGMLLADGNRRLSFRACAALRACSELGFVWIRERSSWTALVRWPSFASDMPFKYFASAVLGLFGIALQNGIKGICGSFVVAFRV